jgi:hypothetical protein
MSVKSYNAKEVAVICGGFIMSGFADGQFLNIVPNSDLQELIVGVDGEGTRSAMNNKSAQITISLMQSSASNPVLEAFAASGETFPMLVKDNSGSTIYSAVTAWVRRRPDAGFDRTAGQRDWLIETDELIGAEGGN